MSCGAGHLGFPIGIKNRYFVEDLPMIISGQFDFNCPSGLIETKLTRNDHWKVLYKFLFFMPIGNPRWPPPQSQKLQIRLNPN
jgi:hypothetical protein